MPTKIAVLGSCVTRDNFNRLFNPDYKQYYQCVLTQQQASIISIMDIPVSFDGSKLDNLQEGIEKFAHQVLATDLTKEFLVHLAEQQPDYLLIDFFGDVYFGIVQFEHGMTTNNRWHLHNTTFYQNLNDKRPLNMLEHADEYVQMLMDSMTRLVDFLAIHVPNCKIIIHKARFISRYMDENGAAAALDRFDHERFNQIWEVFDNLVIDRFQCEYVELDPEKYLVTMNHPLRNLWYLHYEPSYYHDFLKELNKIVYREHSLKEFLA